MAVNFDTAARGQSGWAVYYRGPGIVVTSQFVMTSQSRHPVARLSDVRREVRLTYRARKRAAVAGATGTIFAAALGSAAGSPLLIVATVTAAGFLMAAATVADHRDHPDSLALLATCEGRPIELYRSGDKREFAQVCRAVLRAVQLNQDLVP